MAVVLSIILMIPLNILIIITNFQYSVSIVDNSFPMFSSCIFNNQVIQSIIDTKFDLTMPTK